MTGSGLDIDDLSASGEPERQQTEVMTWRLLAAIAARTRVERIVEMHAGGGQYDTVQVHLGAQPGEGRGPSYLDCNRPGGLHVLTEGQSVPPRDVFGDLVHGLPIDDVATWVLDAAPVQDPVDGRVAAAVELMAEAVATDVGLLDERSWEWRNGRLDASDSSGRRDELFRLVPGADAACVQAPGDLLGLPEYRFWFLLGDGVPVFAIEPRAGRVFIGGAAFDVTEPGATPWRKALAEDADAAQSPGSPSVRAAAARAAFKPIALHLAGRIGSDLVAFEPGQGLSAMARWFRDRTDQVLVVVVGAHENVDVTDDILAYALAWQQDRDLVLILPESHVGLTLDRLPWIESPIRVFTYWSDLEPRPAIVPSRSEVLARASDRPLRSAHTHDLKSSDVLVEQLVQHLNDHWALVAAHRSSYLAWHCLGRQVVRMARTAGGVNIQAGVAYGKPPPGEEPALTIPVREKLSPARLAEVEARVARAVWKRLAGDDAGHVEHRMQAALASTGLRGLGITHFSREYPAWRGDGRPGYIDFLALDRRNMIHVVETKVGTADVKGVLQTLDYATWVAAHAKEIRAERNWPVASRSGAETVVLDFVLAPKGNGPAVGSYLTGQLEALVGSLPWRVAIVADPLAAIPEMSGPWRRSMPPPSRLVARPVQSSRWAASIGAALAKARN